MLSDQAVVITGMGIVSSIGPDPEAFDRALREMRHGFAAYDSPFLAVMAQIRDFDFRKDPVLERVPASVRDKALRLVRRSGPALQSAAAAALQAWERAGIGEEDPERISIVTGGSNLSQADVFGTYRKAADTPEFVSPSYAVSQFDTNLNGLLSELLGIRGEGMSIGGASASGNLCLIQGLRLLRLGIADVCLCAAPYYDPSLAELSAFANLQAFGDYSPPCEPGEVCRPFDRGHRGFVPGQASVCLVLERAQHARQRNAVMLAEAAGGAVALDGNHLPDANPEGEYRAMRNAMADAGVSAAELDYVNSHGTSTPGGDRAETEALLHLLGEEAARIRVNSTKSLTGHCLFSAGLVEAAATVCQIRGGYVHGTRNLSEPEKEGLRLSGRTEEGVRIRCALSNSFGFGGINSAVVIKAI